MIDFEVGSVRLLEKFLGRGAFGTVRLGMVEDTGRQIAVKEMMFPTTEMSASKARNQLENVTREVALMQTLDHINIVKYLGAKRDDFTLYIFMDYIAGGTLRTLIHNMGKLTNSLGKKIMANIVSGLEYLHGKLICHRDIKTENILMTVDGVAKLADFGTSKPIQECLSLCAGLRSLCGTPWYMAPEIISGEPYGLPVDIWAVACTTYEMMTGEKPYYNFENPHAAMFFIATKKKPPPIPKETLKELSTEAVAFMESCFDADPRSRPTVSQLKNHDFVRDSPNESKSSGPGPIALQKHFGNMSDFSLEIEDMLESAGTFHNSSELEQTYQTCTATTSPPPSIPTFPTESVQTRSYGILPCCQKCSSAVSIFMCGDCTPANTRFCPACWEAFHGDATGTSHQKLPLLFNDWIKTPLNGPASPTDWNQKNDDAEDSDVVLCGDGGILLEDGRCVEFIQHTDSESSDSSCSSNTMNDTVRRLRTKSSKYVSWSCENCSFRNPPGLRNCEKCAIQKEVIVKA